MRGFVESFPPSLRVIECSNVLLGVAFFCLKSKFYKGKEFGLFVNVDLRDDL